MSQLSLRALSFIDAAFAAQGQERELAEWQSWLRYSDTELAPHVAQMALHALSGYALALEAQIMSDQTDDAIAAQLENDLGYIAEIEALLVNRLSDPLPAYA
jgi:hypothetical protein